ncbi:hypothetical protein SteCoe_37052 [Stentor coeruleus]|uniref:Uncharacterized protein n=1 Tax=Stentor coeruleus TaxID=5963 RepID=A0A1R2AP21_9CILI|nr:hypothetical protein SteCoe_37052 [Stentor coeruleus]
MLNSNRPIVKRVVLSKRPLSSKHISPQRYMRGSFKQLPNNPIGISQTRYDPILQDIGTSMSPLKFDDYESPQLPVQNLTFNFAPCNKQNRRRRVLVVKHLRTNSEIPNSKASFRKSSGSMMKFFNIAKQEDYTKRQKLFKQSLNNIRASTCKSSGPVTKRVLSELNFEQSVGTRIFDIGEVLSVAHGCINLKNFNNNY